MEAKVIGIDLGKNLCSLAALDDVGRVVFRRRIRPGSLVGFVQKLPPRVLGMEACCGAHHLGRQVASLGHDVRLMPPECVRAYVKAQKNEDRDAEGIAEAATRPTMRFVPLKTEEQLDVQSLHRSRARLVAARTALINQLRALLLERGVIIAKGRTKLEIRLRTELPAIGTVSARMQRFITELVAEMHELDARIAAFDREFKAMARSDEATRRLQSIPGIGVLNGTAIVAAVGMRQPLAADETSQRGLVLCLAKLRQAANPGWSVSQSEGTGICACCSWGPFGAARIGQEPYTAGNVAA